MIGGDLPNRMTSEFISGVLSSNPREYFSNPLYNEQLSFAHKKIEKVENLEKFENLICLYLNDNLLVIIEGLDSLTNLKSLYLQNNMIGNISGLSNLIYLNSLNLSSNRIETITNLDRLTSLEVLLINNNHIGRNGIPDISQLSQLKSLK